jgi:transcriptional regulator with XRE-family HTH domain
MKTYHSEYIRNAIIKNGIKKKEISENTGIDMPELSNFIHGKRPLPLYKVEKIMNELKIILTIKK